MAYADFPYYLDCFKGSLIKDDGTFCTFAERASEYINTVTFDRLEDETLFSTYEKKIKKCCCALAETFFKRNLVFAKGVPNSEDMPLKSESIGAYSLSYTNSYDYLEEITLSEKDFNSLIRQKAMYYLGNTGLMFRGV